MTKSRLEAFSDGVFAIIITIMVLDLRVPHSTSFAALGALLPVFLSYVMSFLYVGVYWNNHHHLLQAAERVDGKILWANLHLLFWLSLTPFTTAWLGENRIATGTVAMYGIFNVPLTRSLLLLNVFAKDADWCASTRSSEIGWRPKNTLPVPTLNIRTFQSKQSAGNTLEAVHQNGHEMFWRIVD